MYRTAIHVILVSLTVLFSISDISSKIRRPEINDFNRLYEQLKEKKNYRVTLDGEEQKSFLTGNKYVYYETVAFFNAGDYQILYHTENPLVVKADRESYEVGFRKIRPAINPAYSKTYTARDLADPKNKQEDYLKTLLLNNNTEQIVIKEFGLEKRKKYYSLFIEESYTLPPGPGSDNPEEKTNIVLKFSDEKMPNDIELTPHYQGWTY